MTRIVLSPTATLFHADCRDALRSLPDNSIDSVPCDPPYELNFMGKGWDDTGIANDPALWREVFRVLKPGGHLAAFSASRTYHRMACAIEDAGFEIRDSLMWIYGTGFPKSQNVAKFIDGLDATEKRRERQLRFTSWMRETGLTGARIDEITATNMGGHYLSAASQPAVATRDLFELMRPHFGCDVPAWVEQMVDERTVESENLKRREVVGRSENGIAGGSGEFVAGNDRSAGYAAEFDITRAHTPQAAEWEGWGTALKPAFEPIVLARKPLSESTVAANVLKWRTGALNIDGCRIHTGESTARVYTAKRTAPGAVQNATGERHGDELFEGASKEGRWPANVVTDGSDEVVGMFPTSDARGGGEKVRATSQGFGTFDHAGGQPKTVRNDSGSAARFFYSAKASKADRNGSKHPTVKPIALMEWLATLITPPGGTVLDPFAGSGTTGIAATRRGFNAILCEREAEYVRDIKARFGSSLLDQLANEHDARRALAALKARAA